MESEGEKLKKVQLTFSFFFSYIVGFIYLLKKKIECEERKILKFWY